MPRFDDFARKARPILLTVARGYVDDHAADDVAQNALWSIYKSWDRVALMSSPVAYAKAAVRHRAIDYLRRHRDIPTADELLVPLAEQRDAEQLNSDYELREILRRAVQRLPSRSAQVIWLSLRGMLIQEIADDLGITPSTVRVLLHRARVQLKKEIGG
ncbi:sigma-70 family RNA polymerase sigma factor [Actinomycetota bacterium Odt1-20B]